MSRYIDADKLNKKYCLQTGFGAFPRHEYFIKLQDLLEAPTADVEEVRHGKWSRHEDYYEYEYYRCSVCGDEFYLYDGNPINNHYFYCPNCGAKMDKEKEE